MKKWREVYLRKIKTKAFNESDFLGAFQAVLDDERATHKTIGKGKVADQLIWHWDYLNDSGHSDYDLPNRVKQNYKSVANHFLKNHFETDDFTDWYLDLGCVKVEGEIVKLK